MAKRSDFAQKLLDDLRLRKERMAAAQRSKGTKRPLPADAYAYSKRKGSMELKAQENTSFRAGSRSDGGNRLLTNGQASNQIVPFGRGQKSEHMGNLSTALAFALENGGKLRIDSSGNGSVLSFLHQIGGRRELDYGKMERRNIAVDRPPPSASHLRSLSNLHIEEISKGAQKLNQILRACSNGLNFDRYSIEIGRELLKGAVDLEESLRMLVGLQEASEYMINPQRKSRITLLEDDEDNDDNSVLVAEQKQLDRPKFSFDKPSRNYHKKQEVAKTDIRLRLAAVTYSSEATRFNHQKQVPADTTPSSHKRSISYGPETFSEKNHSSSSQTKQEKGRIPSVIAKLMGLDELPGNVDSKYSAQKDFNAKQKVGIMMSKKPAQENSKKVEQRATVTENLELPSVRQRGIQASVIPAIQDTAASQSGKNLADRNGSMLLAINDKTPALKNLEDIKMVKGSRKATYKTDKEQSNSTQLNLHIRSRKEIQEKERKQDSLKHREQTGTGKGETKELVSKDELPQMIPDSHKKLEAALTLQEKTASRESMIQAESGYTNKLLLGSQQKLHVTLGFQQLDMFQKSELHDKRLRTEEEQQNAKEKLQGKKQKGNKSISISLLKTMHTATNFQKKKTQLDQATDSRKGSTEHTGKVQVDGFQNGRHHQDHGRDSSSTNSNVKMKDSIRRNSSQNSSRGDQQSETARAGVQPTMGDKQVQAQPQPKAKGTKIYKPEIPRMIDELMIKRSGTLYKLPRPLTHQSSILQEGKQRGSEKFSMSKDADQVKISKSKEVEAHIIKSNKTEASIQSLTGTQELNKGARDESFSFSSPKDKGQSLESQASANDSDQKVTSMVKNNQQVPESELDTDREELKFHNDQPGTDEESKKMSIPSKSEHQKPCKPEIPEPLTESEDHLKQILVRSQLFLNTAEALFRLNIPFGILDSSDRSCQDEESKIILDCGYEVMKRKGKRQELSVHPFMNVLIPPIKVRSLDDLAKHLHRDFEKLKLYGNNRNVDFVSEDYIPKMIENEVYNINPDVNCMWDLGWNDMIFAFLEKDDVIRDVERHVFNALLDEITRDLYTSVSA
ncbi:hypothetical protein SLE2022_215740 [Rubroshorea leprosula]